jgi:hypothetical protein
MKYLTVVRCTKTLAHSPLSCVFFASILTIELMGNYRTVSGGVSTTNLASVLADRQNHSLLELRPGDLIAFRHREGSIYCYNHFSEFLVNGTVVDTTMAGVDVRYSRIFAENWYKPSLNVVLGTGEEEKDLTKWLPPRTRMLASTTPVSPGSDQFETIDPKSADHKRSNWYWRIQIPSNLPNSGGI